MEDHLGGNPGQDRLRLICDDAAQGAADAYNLTQITTRSRRIDGGYAVDIGTLQNEPHHLSTHRPEAVMDSAYVFPWARHNAGLNLLPLGDRRVC
jgi:hypothetical protein